MPTTLFTVPVQARSGTNVTPYTNLPNAFTFVQFQSSAADAVHSDPANSIRFEVLHATSAAGANERIIQVEDWVGGTYIPKGGSTPIPRAVDLTFGPVPSTGFV